METAHQMNISSCDQCNYITQNNTDLKQHIDKHHKQILEGDNKILPKSTQKTKRLSCNFCEQKCNKKETYEKHMMKAHGERPENLNTESDQNLIQTTLPFQKKTAKL